MFKYDLALHLLTSLCVLSLFVMVKRKRRLHFHPPIGMNGAQGTATYGKSTRLQGWVISSRAKAPQNKMMSTLKKIFQVQDRGCMFTIKISAPLNSCQNMFSHATDFGDGLTFSLVSLIAQIFNLSCEISTSTIDLLPWNLEQTFMIHRQYPKDIWDLRSAWQSRLHGFRLLV